MNRHKNREVEIKLPVPDLAGLQRRLRHLKARKLRQVYEWNALFDTPDHRLGSTGRLLRLRIERPLGATRRQRRAAGAVATGLLTFKGRSGPRGRYKEREELELMVGNPERLALIFERVGLHPSFLYEKYRTSYRLPGLPSVHLDLDETPVGVFLELEGARRGIDQVARRLGYRPADYITASYWALYRDDCRRRGTVARHMLFEGLEKLHFSQSFLDKGFISN
jgi:adenylate cyclase, class 2